MPEWIDDTPVYLILLALSRNPDGSLDNLTIDVGEKGWMTTHADWLRRPAEWYLVEKATDKVLLAQMVFDGEQPYYVAKHIGQMEIGSGRSRSLIAYGIGKKIPAVKRRTQRGRMVVERPERTERIWLLPSGVVCGGEDVEPIAFAILKSMEWQELINATSTAATIEGDISPATS